MSDLDITQEPVAEEQVAEEQVDEEYKDMGFLEYVYKTSNI